MIVRALRADDFKKLFAESHTYCIIYTLLSCNLRIDTNFFHKVNSMVSGTSKIWQCKAIKITKSRKLRSSKGIIHTNLRGKKDSGKRTIFNK